ncbi:MAG TPA: cell division protein FtsL [Kofleriaceae bacterium]|jgi:cell division protein FtsL
MVSAASLYRIFQRPDGAAPSMRVVVIALVAIATLATAVGVVRVSRQHDVLRLGFELARTSDHVRELREAHRQLELELATLSAPDRIRTIAASRGMVPVPPDHIRVVERAK